jgi:hypothetical protein
VRAAEGGPGSTFIVLFNYGHGPSDVVFPLPEQPHYQRARLATMVPALKEYQQASRPYVDTATTSRRAGRWSARAVEAPTSQRLLGLRRDGLLRRRRLPGTSGGTCPIIRQRSGCRYQDPSLALLDAWAITSCDDRLGFAEPEPMAKPVILGVRGSTMST